MGEFGLGLIECRKIDGRSQGLLRTRPCRQSSAAGCRRQAADQDGQK
jgi:hypothetical protein